MQHNPDGADLTRDPLRAQAAPAGETSESVFGPDNRLRVGDPTAFPWSSIGKVTIGTANGTYVGTGFLIGPNHMLTAGHVVHSAVYGGDGWAQTISVAFGKDGYDEFYGRAQMVQMRAAADWLATAATGSDWALVTLDRSIGAATGWMTTWAHPSAGFFDGATVTLAGYPADLEGGRGLYAATGPILSGSAERLLYNGTLDTAGGMSGAPLWQTFSGGTERRAIGIHTTGVGDPLAPGAANGATRLTAERLALIQEWMDQDALLLPPVDLSDLVDADALFETASATLTPGAVAAGGTVTLTFSPRNMGTAELEAGWQVAVYASVNTVISAFDTLLAVLSGPALAPFETGTVQASIALPASLPAGNYYIGWILDPGEAVAEFDEGNNIGRVLAPLTVADAPDLIARNLQLGSAQWAPGDAVGVLWEIANQGAGVAAAVSSALYISADALIDPGDLLLLMDADGRILAPGASWVEGQPGQFLYPGGLGAGTYHVGVLVDPGGALGESDEGNNASATIQVTVTNPGVALTGTSGSDALTGGSGDDTALGLAGNDTLSGRAGADSLDGGADDDRLYGEDGGDSLTGGPGFDTLLGQAGDDLLIGDTGDPAVGQADLLNGGSGEDSLHGDGGPDTLHGGEGADLLEGGQGFDQLFGNTGADTLRGGSERDTLNGGPGDDLIEGGSGNDMLIGEDGADTLDGGAGPDFIDAGTGDDSALGGSGDDIVLGRAGLDTLDGGPGDDILRGGSGADTLLGGPGDDRLYGEEEADRIEGGAGADLAFGGAGDDTLLGGSGADTLVGEDGDDSLDGGGEDDRLTGSGGADTLEGGAGADRLDGGGGDDLLSGGEGADTLFGRDGADSLTGGEGADFLAGGEGDDTLSGGTGDDRMRGESGADRFVFAPGDGADHILDMVLGTDFIAFLGGGLDFGQLTIGSDAQGNATIGYTALDPGDVITLVGIAAGSLSDDGTFVLL